MTNGYHRTDCAISVYEGEQARMSDEDLKTAADNIDRGMSILYGDK